MADSSEFSSRPARLPLLLALLLLAVPGAGSSRFNGLPFDSKLEVAALGLLATVLFCRILRSNIATILSTAERRQMVILLLAVLIVLKTFTFFRFPIGENFEVCLKSIYTPVDAVCEKSYEYPFGNDDRVNGRGDITRVDPVINYRTSTNDPASTFGASHTTWRLPFQNEYPRFDQLWLNRLPFTADIGAAVGIKRAGLLPVEFVGEVTATVGAASASSSDYEFRRVMLLPVSAARQEMRIQFRFTDDDTSVMPETAPAARGPYAHLVIGAPIERDATPPLNIRIRGHVVNLLDERAITRVVVRQQDQVATSELTARPDVATYFGDPRHENSGFSFTLPISESIVKVGEYEVTAILDDGSEEPLGRVRFPGVSETITQLEVERAADSRLTSDFKSWLTLSETPPLLRATYHSPPSLPGKAALAILAISQLLIVLLSGLLLTRHFWRNRAALLAVVGALLLLLFVEVSGPRVGTVFSLEQPLNWYLSTLIVLGALLWLVRGKRSHLATFASVGGLIVAGPRILLAYRSWGGLSEAPWWGYMLFRDRPMDWFPFQGYAYRMFVDESLRGGESVFYFVPGARYFILISHILFGNNDTLIGILVGASLIGAAIWCGAALLSEINPRPFTLAVTSLACFTVVWVTTGSLSIQLASASASEVFAWTLFFLASVSVLSPSASNQKSAITGLAFGLMVFLRPNYLAISVIFVVGATVLILNSEKETSRVSRLVRTAWLTTGLVVGVSLTLAHNLHYGGSFVLFVDTAAGGTEVFPARDLLGLFWNRDVQAAVWDRLRQYSFWTQPSFDVELLGSWVAQVAYLVALVRLAVSRTLLLPRAMFLLAPVGYVISTTPYAITTIPERQSNMFTFALAVSAGISTVLETRNAVREVPGSGPSREYEKSTQSATS